MTSAPPTWVESAEVPPLLRPSDVQIDVPVLNEQSDTNSALLPSLRSSVIIARILQVVTGALVLVYLGSTIFRSHHVTSTLYDGWIGNLGYGGCAALCGWRALTVRRARLAWTAVALSLVFFTLGAVLWTTLVQYQRPLPYPSVSDAFFLVFFPLAYLGVGMLAIASVPRRSFSIWLDGLIAALGFVSLESAVVLAAISANNHGNLSTVVTNFAYPVGDLILVALVIAVFSMRGWRCGSMWWMLGAGLAIFAFADSVYVLRVTSGTYITGTPLDSLWLIGTFLVASAAWQPRPARAHPARYEQPVAVPGLFVLSSAGILVYASIHHVLPLARVFAIATMLVGLARMAHAFVQLRSLAETKREARTDELTNLPNRRSFSETLTWCLTGMSAHESLAVLMIDLDRFKEINDSLGHKVGDEVLKQLGARLAKEVGGTSTVARFGGDEFGLLVSPLRDTSEAVEVAERVSLTLRRPLTVADMTLRVDASIGIVVTSGQSDDADALLQKADIAIVPGEASAPSLRDLFARGESSHRDAAGAHGSGTRCDLIARISLALPAEARPGLRSGGGRRGARPLGPSDARSPGPRSIPGPGGAKWPDGATGHHRARSSFGPASRVGRPRHGLDDGGQFLPHQPAGSDDAAARGRRVAAAWCGPIAVGDRNHRRMRDG